MLFRPFVLSLSKHRKSKSRGAAPHADSFLCAAKERNQRKAAPVCRRCAVPSISRKRAGLRNSHDPLRGHVLKQCSPNPTARLRLIEAALRGLKAKNQTQNRVGNKLPTTLK